MPSGRWPAPPEVALVILSDVLEKHFCHGSPEQKLQIKELQTQIAKLSKSSARRMSSYEYEERVGWPLRIMKICIQELRDDGVDYTLAREQAAKEIAPMFGATPSTLESWFTHPARRARQNGPSKTTKICGRNKKSRRGKADFLKVLKTRDAPPPRCTFNRPFRNRSAFFKGLTVPHPVESDKAGLPLIGDTSGRYEED
jgi:hypothetical protein